MPRFFTWLLTIFVVLIGISARAAEPNVTLVLAAEAQVPRLERHAAEELATLLKTLYSAKVAIEYDVVPKAETMILVGSPATNPAVKTWAGDRWPKLTNQGHVLRTVTHEGRKALLVGGGSPVATLWAVHELGQRLGMRYLARGDGPPAESIPFKIDGFDLVLEPIFRVRAFQGLDSSPVGPEAWGLGDQRRLLRQLSCLKFNQLVLPIHPWQPFAPPEINGLKKRSAVLFGGQRFPIDGETAGRTAFRPEAKEFTNPGFANSTTPADWYLSGRQYVNGLIDIAHQLGMKVTLVASAEEFSKEYGDKLEASQVRRVLGVVYRDADEVVAMDTIAGPLQQTSTWQRLAPGMDGKKNNFANSARRLAQDKALWARALPDREVIVVPLDGDGVLPAVTMGSVHALLRKLAEDNREGYMIQCANPTDQDICLHYLGRAACDAGITPQGRL